MHIVYVSKLRLNHISSHLFCSIAKTLNSFISKRRSGKIAPVPEHLKIYHSFNIYIYIYARDLRFGTNKLNNVLQVIICFYSHNIM